MLCSYCWIDTWCIDQDDTEDKLRQMPLMDEIYKGALLVLITVRHHFTFSQEDWNAAIAGCHELCHKALMHARLGGKAGGKS